MALRDFLRGTLETVFQIGLNGPQWKNVSGILEARDSNDGDYAIVRGLPGSGNNDLVTKQEFNTIVFGTQFQDAEEVNEDTNSTTTYLEFLSMDVTNLPLGKYRFGWYYIWDVNSASRQIKVRVRMDGATDLQDPSGDGQVVEEPKDTRNRNERSGFVYLDNLSGNHTFNIEFGRFSSGGTTKMRHARFEFWRVS